MSTFGLGIVHLQNHCGTEITKVNLHSGCRRDVQKSSCQSRSEPKNGFPEGHRILGKGRQVSFIGGTQGEEEWGIVDITM